MADARVGIVMGSESDQKIMEEASATLKEFGVAAETNIISAHRAPQSLKEYAGSARERGLEVIIAGAGMAAHLPGVIASLTTIPVIGVPLSSRTLGGLDALMSIVQMPKGVPVATVAIDSARNAAILAVEILGVADDRLVTRLAEFRLSLSAQSTFNE